MLGVSTKNQITFHLYYIISITNCFPQLTQSTSRVSPLTRGLIFKLQGDQVARRNLEPGFQGIYENRIRTRRA